MCTTPIRRLPRGHLGFQGLSQPSVNLTPDHPCKTSGWFYFSNRGSVTAVNLLVLASSCCRVCTPAWGLWHQPSCLDVGPRLILAHLGFWHREAALWGALTFQVTWWHLLSLTAGWVSGSLAHETLFQLWMASTRSMKLGLRSHPRRKPAWMSQPLGRSQCHCCVLSWVRVLFPTLEARSSLARWCCTETQESPTGTKSIMRVNGAHRRNGF